MLCSARGKHLLVHTATVLADPSTSLPWTGEQPVVTSAKALWSSSGSGPSPASLPGGGQQRGIVPARRSQHPV